MQMRTLFFSRKEIQACTQKGLFIQSLWIPFRQYHDMGTSIETATTRLLEASGAQFAYTTWVILLRQSGTDKINEINGVFEKIFKYCWTCSQPFTPMPLPPESDEAGNPRLEAFPRETEDLSLGSSFLHNILSSHT